MSGKEKVVRGVMQLLRGCTILAFALFALRAILLSPVQKGGHYETTGTRPIFVPDAIQSVSANADMVCILYRNSGAVNVYDGAGRFLWSVSIPWHDHDTGCQMRGEDGSLFVWQNRYTVYQYDLKTGAYQGSFPQPEHQEEFPASLPPAERPPESEIPEGTITYDALTVYRQLQGERVPVVARSGWVRLLFFPYIWALGFFSFLVQAVWDMLTAPWRRWRKTASQPASGRSVPKASSPKAVRRCVLAKVVIGLCVLYAAAMLIAAIFSHSVILSIGVMPLTVCFIVSGIYQSNTPPLPYEDACAVQLWIGRMWAAMFGAFLSAVVGNVLASVC